MMVLKIIRLMENTITTRTYAKVIIWRLNCISFNRDNEFLKMEGK
jgi:hypothetical protein